MTNLALIMSALASVISAVAVVLSAVTLVRRINLALAATARLEAAAVKVATDLEVAQAGVDGVAADLADAHRRADEVDGHPGEAADAAAQRTAAEKGNRVTPRGAVALCLLGLFLAGASVVALVQALAGAVNDWLERVQE